ncbi:folate family ECF transporter S component [Haloimpatiens sp. FM7315]|uniref:folate family ECF transporter S component n=1 Tax=Haloimpatiens sp. FM7315 TaxID=3298609 RepID=UPI00370C9AD0
MQKKQTLTVQTLVYLSVLAAMQIVLTRFLSIQTPIIRIGFGFIPLMLVAMLFGPLIGGAYAVVVDFIGIMLVPTGGGYFPGFSVSAFLGAFIYGVFLYKKPKNLWRITLSVIIVALFVDTVLNTVWLSIITGKAVYLILPPRVIKNCIMAAVKIVTMATVWKVIGEYLEKNFVEKVRCKAHSAI